MSIISPKGDNDCPDVDVNHPLQQISDFKSLAKGSMDVAYLLATVNQLRNAHQLVDPYKDLMYGLLSISLVFQVTSSILLLVEKMSMSYTNRKKINISIGVMMILVFFINAITTVFSGSEYQEMIMTTTTPPPTPTTTTTLNI